MIITETSNEEKHNNDLLVKTGTKAALEINQLGLLSSHLLPPGCGMGLDMICNFYLLTNYKITYNSTTIKIEKISSDLESLEF